MQPEKRGLAGHPAGSIFIPSRVQFIPAWLDSVTFLTTLRLGESLNLSLNIVISSIKEAQP